MTQFIQGFKFLLSGFKLILRSRVRLYVIIPLLINTLLFATVIIYGAGSLSDLINAMIEKWHWLKWLEWLLWPILIIVTLTVIFFCFSMVANLIGAPFNGLLAEAVEQTLTETLADNTISLPLSQVIVHTIQSECQKLFYFLIRALPLLILFIIPAINIVAPLLWFLFGAWMLAIEYMDYPMGNHDILFQAQRKKLAANKQLVLGFGAGVAILTMIPVINFLAMPVAVAGATRMYVEHPNLKA